MEIIKSFVDNFISMFIDMASYIMLGLFFVGLLNTFVKRERVLKFLGNDSFSSVVTASVVGVPLPLCSCGVVPTAVELKKGGASNGAVSSFLISTPQTGIDSMLATYSMMGPIMAIYRPIAAFISGILGGAIINFFAKNDKLNINGSTESCCSAEPVAETSKCCCSAEPVAETSKCCCSAEPVAETSECCCSAEPLTETSKCCCSAEPVASSCCSSAKPTSSNKFVRVFTYAYGKFLDDISTHFIVGMLLATIIATFVPTDFFVNLGLNKGILSMLAMILVGLPMYICSTASIPIALTLITKGLSVGSAFVFLFTGPVTNIASMLVLGKMLGKKITILYISVVMLCSILFGSLLDFLFDTFDTLTIISSEHMTHHHMSSNWFSITIAIIFAILVAKSIIIKAIKKTSK